MVCACVLDRHNQIYSSAKCLDLLCDPPSHIQCVPGLKQPGHRAEVKNEWKYTTRTCHHAMHRDSFTFSFITRVLESIVSKRKWSGFVSYFRCQGVRSLSEWGSLDRAILSNWIINGLSWGLSGYRSNFPWCERSLCMKLIPSFTTTVALCPGPSILSFHPIHLHWHNLFLSEWSVLFSWLHGGDLAFLHYHGEARHP